MTTLDPNEIVERARFPPRCNACSSCRHVTTAARVMMSGMTVRHLSDEDVKFWNQRLFDHPCERWSKEVRDEIATEMLQFSTSIRPEVRKSTDGRHFSRLALRKE